MKACEADSDRSRPAVRDLAGSLIVGLANAVPFGTTLTLPLAPTAAAEAAGARPNASPCAPP